MKNISDYSTLAFIVGTSIDMMAIQLPKTDLFQFFLNEDNKSELAEKLKSTGFPRKEVDYTMPRKVYLQQRSLDGSLSTSWGFEASIYDFEKLVAEAGKNNPVMKSVLKDFKAKAISDDEACEVFGNMSYDAEHLIADGFAKMDFRKSNFGRPDFVPEAMSLAQGSSVYDF